MFTIVVGWTSSVWPFAFATTVMVAVPADVSNCPAAMVGDDESLLPSITLNVAIRTKIGHWNWYKKIEQSKQENFNDLEQ